MIFEVKRPNGDEAFSFQADNYQEAVEIVDIQAYYMKRDYRLFQNGQELYKTY